MKRAELLDTAKEFVTRDRNATHGEPEDNFGTIAAYWSAHLEIPITSADVAIMMNLMKCARLKANPAHADNWIDGIGYLACGGELALRGTVTPPVTRSLHPAKPNKGREVT